MQNQTAQAHQTHVDEDEIRYLSDDNGSQRINDAAHSARVNLESQIPWLEQLPASISTILDIGCGPGSHCEYFKDRGMVPTGIDPWAKGFQHHGEIEFHESLDALTPERKFDAVFVSHFLEHCPNPLRSILSWRKYVKDGGYIVIIVPKYDARPCNTHWITGWNVAQLAMFLVAAGFDCSQSTFSQFGINVCGFGQKKDFEETNCYIQKSVPYLPKALADLQFKIDADEFLPGDLAFASPSEVRYLGEVEKIHLPTPASAAIRLDMKGKWKDACFFYPGKNALDLSNQKMALVAMVQGAPPSLRIAMGSDKNSGDWANCADIWFTFKEGMNLFHFHKQHFQLLRGNVEWRKIDQFAFGGLANGCTITAWLLYGKEGQFRPVA